MLGTYIGGRIEIGYLHVLISDVAIASVRAFDRFGIAVNVPIQRMRVEDYVGSRK